MAAALVGSYMSSPNVRHVGHGDLIKPSFAQQLYPNSMSHKHIVECSVDG